MRVASTCTCGGCRARRAASPPSHPQGADKEWVGRLFPDEPGPGLRWVRAILRPIEIAMSGIGWVIRKIRR
jgi:hypothetical protein